MHDSRIAVIAYFLLESINNGNYDKGLNPIKTELVDQLKLDIKGYYSGALDLGIEIVIEADLKESFKRSLNILKKEVSKKGEIISKNKCEEIDKLCTHYRADEKFHDLPTSELINWISKIEHLLKN